MPDDTLPHEEPNSFTDLPIQPTGSGVQDLEIAYEQMKLAQDDPAAGAPLQSDDVGDPAFVDDTAIPTEDDEATRISAAHPS